MRGFDLDENELFLQLAHGVTVFKRTSSHWQWTHVKQKLPRKLFNNKKLVLCGLKCYSRLFWVFSLQILNQLKRSTKMRLMNAVVFIKEIRNNWIWLTSLFVPILRIKLFIGIHEILSSIGYWIKHWEHKTYSSSTNFYFLFKISIDN